jgi:hypothetical protein
MPRRLTARRPTGDCFRGYPRDCSQLSAANMLDAPCATSVHLELSAREDDEGSWTCTPSARSSACLAYVFGPLLAWGLQPVAICQSKQLLYPCSRRAQPSSSTTYLPGAVSQQLVVPSKPE